MEEELRQEDYSFEDALARLETVVKKLESGEMKLDESLCLFEEGVRLSRYCSKKLEEARGKVEILKEGGKEPFVPETQEGEEHGNS